jgi:hypothetical protein
MEIIPGMPEAVKFMEYAKACREMADRTPDAEAKQTLLRLVKAWEEVARETGDDAGSGSS